MSGHCPKCGDYCEEDDARPCAKCATTPDERKAAEEWARQLENDLSDDGWKMQARADLTSTKLAATRWERAEPVVNRAVEVMETVVADFERAIAKSREQPAFHVGGVMSVREETPFAREFKEALAALKGLTQ